MYYELLKNQSNNMYKTQWYSQNLELNVNVNNLSLSLLSVFLRLDFILYGSTKAVQNAQVLYASV